MGCCGSKITVEPHHLYPLVPHSDDNQIQSRERIHCVQETAVAPLSRPSILPPSPPSPPSPPPLPPTTQRALPRSFRKGGRGGLGDFQNITLSSTSQSIPGDSDNQIKPSHRDLMEAIKAVSDCLNSLKLKYAIVDGAGLMVLGSTRATDDIPLVIYPPTQLAAAKTELLRDSRFVMNRRRRHATFEASTGALVDIIALSSPGTFKPRFDESTRLIVAGGEGDGVCVLNAPLFLESKCGALVARSEPRKRLTDAQDILFILAYMRREGIRTTGLEVPSASPSFVADFDRANPGSAALFHEVGIE